MGKTEENITPRYWHRIGVAARIEGKLKAGEDGSRCSHLSTLFYNSRLQPIGRIDLKGGSRTIRFRRQLFCFVIMAPDIHLFMEPK